MESQNWSKMRIRWSMRRSKYPRKKLDKPASICSRRWIAAGKSFNVCARRSRKRPASWIPPCTRMPLRQSGSPLGLEHFSVICWPAGAQAPIARNKRTVPVYAGTCRFLRNPVKQRSGTRTPGGTGVSPIVFGMGCALAITKNTLDSIDIQVGRPQGGCGASPHKVEAAPRRLR